MQGDVLAAKAGETAQPAPGRAARVAGAALVALAVDREGRGLPRAGATAAYAGGSRPDAERPGPACAARRALEHAFVGALGGSHTEAAAAHRGARETAAPRKGLRAGGEPRTTARRTGTRQADALLERTRAPGPHGTARPGDVDV